MTRTRHIHRRVFVKSALVAGGLVVAGARRGVAQVQESAPAAGRRVQPCLFTKPLGNRKAAELPAILNGLGINAVDLTCRPEGHVLPERVADDLPKALEQLGKAGITVPMITTGIVDATKDHAESIVKTVSQLGIGHIRVGYYTYTDLRRILPTLAEAKARLRDVGALCRQYKVHAGYHLHSGMTVGAAQWDLYQLIDGLPPEDIGCHYDARHATVEGGLGGWEIGVNLLLQRITVAVVKDFRWQKRDKGTWQATDVPLGEGMVRHDKVLKTLRQASFAGPVSLHCEYCKFTVPTNSPAEKANWENIRRDWRTLQDLLKRAELV